VPDSTGTAWRLRQIHVTAERICFSKIGSEVQIDEIPLDDVVKLIRKAGKIGLWAGSSRALHSLSSPDEDKQKSVVLAALQRREIQSLDNNLPPSLTFEPEPLNQADEVIPSELDSTIITIRTAKNGFNAGRSYRIKAETVEMVKDIIQTLRKEVDWAITHKMGSSMLSQA